MTTKQAQSLRQESLFYSFRPDSVLFHHRRRHHGLFLKTGKTAGLLLGQRISPCCYSSSTTPATTTRIITTTSCQYAKRCPEEEEEQGEENDNVPQEKGQDWRSFRAHLVSNEKSIMKDGESTMMSNNHKIKESWIHDSGLLLECGSILLNHPAFSKKDRNHYRYALKEQWLHKSVVLILECESHSTSSASQQVTGIILNRPTDLVLYDNNVDMENQPGWEVWFGGDEFGIHSEHPKFFCLHSMTDSPEALALSNEVIPGIYFCSLQDAKELVAATQQGSSSSTKHCTNDDFWVFCGFQTWNRQELEEELKDGLWHAIATDASLVEKGHSILKTANARSDGDRTWKILMRLVGQRFRCGGDDDWCNTSFSDRMLKEWCLNKLEFDEPPPFLREDGARRRTRMSSQFFRQQQQLKNNPIKAGTLIQATLDCSKNVMTNQQFHCSTILILQDDDDMTVGIIMNMPSQMGVDLWMNNDSGSLFDKEMVTLPLRYGGPLGGPCYEDHCEDEPLFTFHLSSALRERNIGEPIGEERNGIWKCSYEDLLYSIEQGIAFVEDFALVDGICVWRKEQDEFGNIGGGILKEILNGNFNMVESRKLEEVWKCLSSMEVLTLNNIDKNLRIISDAWEKGSHDGTKVVSNNDETQKALYDEALKHWMELYLLGDVTTD